MKYKSDAYEASHLDAVALYEIGAISEARMKEYDDMCLVQEDKTPAYEIENPQVLEHATA